MMTERALAHAPIFGASRVKGHSLEAFARWVQASSPPEQTGALALPPLQRHSLWRPRQIIAFWDSLLRGLPVGMFYLVRRQPGQDALGFEAGAATRSALPEGFDLIDGQQRTRALMLAFDQPQASGKCLWVDLASAEPDGAPSLRLTTRNQPFGYDAEGIKLGIRERRAARTLYEERYARGDDLGSTFDHQLFDREIEAGAWPPSPHLVNSAGGSAFAPMNEIIIHFRTFGSDRTGFSEAVTALVGLEARQVSGVVVCSLHAALERFAAAEVALLLVDLETAQGDGSDLLLRLFERVGAGGTALSESERLYSIYKHHFPRVRDLVETIEASSGRIMTSTLIANTALRLANVSSSEAHEAPVPHALGALLNPRRSDDRAERFRSALINLLPTELGNTSTPPTTGRLPAAFATVMDLLRFDSALNPNGLPKLMLAELPHELVQVMVYWAVCAGAPGRVASRSAAEAIRFALFWRLCATSHLQCARNAIHWLRAREQAGADLSIFPGSALYRLLTGQAEESWGQNAQPLVTPNQMLNFSRSAPRGATWLSSKNRFEHDQNHPARRLFSAWWWSGGRILLWLQRRYLEAEFAHYDPLSEHEEDRPVDLDHLQPKAHWRFDWRQRDKHLAQLPDEGERWAFNEGRDPLGNSVGNYRWVGSAKNRSDGALGLADKLRRARGEDGGEIEAWLAEAFDLGAIDAWIRADASEGWTRERVAQFQRVVEERGLWLYRRFFEGAGFEQWLDEPTAF